MNTVSGQPASGLPSIPPVPPPQPQRKYRVLWVFPLLIFIMLAFIIFVVTVGGLSKQSPSTPQPTGLFSSPTNIITDTPTLAFSPTPTIGATASALPILWTIYTNTQYFPGLGVSLTFPYGWSVNYRKSIVTNPVANFLNKIDFDFLPAAEKIDAGAKDGMGWGGISIAVYTRVASITDWISQTYPPEKDKLAPFPDSTIGGTPAYLIAPRKEVASDDPIRSTFTPRDIVQGNRYIYEFTFSQDGKGEYKNTIKRAIYPFFHFD